MSDDTVHSAVIGGLAADLRPVRRLASPWRRTALWLGAAAWMALLLSLFADLPALWLRLASAPDMWLSEVGALLTAMLAGLAALQTAVPGRAPWWGLAPLPALALWVGASTAGCLRLAPASGAQPETPMHPLVCLEFLVLVSVPMAALMTVLLARGYPLHPARTAALAGLASAGAAAGLLAMIHPFDATADDLLVHAAGVVAIVSAARIIGGKALRIAAGR